MGLTGNLRYYIDRSTHFSYDVLDRQNPGKVIFSAVRNASRPQEYAIVSRIFDAPTEKTVVSMAGMTFGRAGQICPAFGVRFPGSPLFPIRRSAEAGNICPAVESGTRCAPDSL